MAYLPKKKFKLDSLRWDGYGFKMFSMGSLKRLAVRLFRLGVVIALVVGCDALEELGFEDKKSKERVSASPATRPDSSPTENERDPFVSVWTTAGTNESVALPLVSGYEYDFSIDWGDGTEISQVTAFDDPDGDHVYANPGDYTVTISGTLEAWSFADGGSKDVITSVTDLGDTGWKNLSGAFHGCVNLVDFFGGNVSLVTDMSSMFEGASSVELDISRWNVSQVTDMSSMFEGATLAEPDMANWDFTNVTDMTDMFDGIALPTENYTRMLMQIYTTSRQNNVVLDAGNSRYSQNIAPIRNSLVEINSTCDFPCRWQITDLGAEP